MDRKQDNPLISVVIPIYNVASYLQSCLDSIYRQTYRPLEVILVDDCGTDNSMNIAEKYVNEHNGEGTSFRILHHSHNRGLSAVRNTGTKSAKGEFIIYLDSDDCFEPTMISDSYDAITSIDADFTISDFFSDEENANRSSHITCDVDSFESRDDFFLALANCQIGVSAWGKLFRKSYVIQNGISFIEGIVNEDEAWLFNMAAKAKRIALLKKPLYYYRYNETSIMSSLKMQKKAESLYITIYEYLRIIETEQPLKESLSVYRLYMRLVVMYYGVCIKAGIRFQILDRYDSRYFSLFNSYVPKYYLLWNWIFKIPLPLRRACLNVLIGIHG